MLPICRQQFVFSRAKANWTRSVLEKERFTWIMRFWRRNQQWENPAESISLMCGLITFSFYPQVCAAPSHSLHSCFLVSVAVVWGLGIPSPHSWELPLTAALSPSPFSLCI